MSEGYERRCEWCRFSEAGTRYAGNWSMHCTKLKAKAAAMVQSRLAQA